MILINDRISSHSNKLEIVLNKIFTNNNIKIPNTNGSQETENYTKERLLNCFI